MLLWILVIVLCVALDLVTKQLVVRNMALYSTIPLIPKLLSFTYIQNRGAAWGILSDNRWVFLVITGIAIIVLPLLLYKYRKLHFMFGFSLSLIIGGAIGNMIDRIFLGYVVDFIEFTFIDFPIFNVADICVTVGAALMFVYLMFIDKTFFAETGKKKTEEQIGEDK